MIVFLANFFESKNFSNLILVWVEGGDAVPPEHDGGHLRLRAAAGRVCAQTHRHPLLLPPPRTHAREVGSGSEGCVTSVDPGSNLAVIITQILCVILLKV